MASPLGSAPSIILGVGVGTAAAAAIEPLVEPAKQQAWSNNPHQILDPGLLARLVAQGGVDLTDAGAEALLSGYTSDKLDALIYLSQTVPGFAEAVTGLRRTTITADDFLHTLVKGAMDSRYYAAVQDLANTWLTPEQVALGIVRGTIPDPGILPVTLDTTGTIAAYPQFGENTALQEAAGGGIDRERLTAMVGSIGLPMSLQQAASATFRQIIQRGDFNRAVLESDTRPEWADAIFAQAAEIPSARDYVELYLRGWITQNAMYAGTALHGMSTTDSDLLYEQMGRPLPVHQITTGLARGGVFQPTATGIQDPYEASVHEANLRPEFYDLAIANKYTIPGYFVIKALLAAGTITQAEGEQYYLDLGWPPDLAAKAAAAEAVATTSSASPVKSATTTALTSLRKAYIGGQVTAATAPDYLTQLGIDPAVQPQLLAVWDVQKNVEALTTPTA